MEFNKAFAAILLAGIIGMVSGIVADALITPEHPAEPAYAIDTSAVSGPATDGPAEDVGLPPIAPLLASADIAAGQNVSRACAACHTFEEGGPNRVGPNNWNIMGAPVAHLDGFNYSATLRAMHDEGVVWGYEEMNAFLANPRAYAPGTTMSFAGVRNPQDRANLIAWMRTLSDDPLPLPEILPEEDEPAAEEPAGAEPTDADPAAPTGVTAPEGAVEDAAEDAAEEPVDGVAPPATEPILPEGGPAGAEPAGG